MRLSLFVAGLMSVSSCAVVAAKSCGDALPVLLPGVEVPKDCTKKVSKSITKACSSYLGTSTSYTKTKTTTKTLTETSTKTKTTSTTTTSTFTDTITKVSKTTTTTTVTITVVKTSFAKNALAAREAAPTQEPVFVPQEVHVLTEDTLLAAAEVSASPSAVSSDLACPKITTLPRVGVPDFALTSACSCLDVTASVTKKKTTVTKFKTTTTSTKSTLTKTIVSVTTKKKTTTATMTITETSTTATTTTTTVTPVVPTKVFGPPHDDMRK